MGIYIHVPFCRSQCPYCDFYSVRVTEELLDRYTFETVRRIGELKELALAADTVYFGGGTPSLLGGSRLGRIMEALSGSVDICDGAEITAEANPSSDLSGFLDGCAVCGVNRLSLGMQSAVREELRAIGRRHSAEDILKCMEAANVRGIDNISLDLMLGIPHQTPDSLAVSLGFIEKCAPAHVSAYMLKIEEGTPFYAMREWLDIADDDALADLWCQAFSRLEAIGLLRYEISNAARPGFESRHNIKYWNCDEYIGVGPSAHGFFNGRRYCYGRSLEGYLSGDRSEDDGPGGSPEEYVMLRLRLTEGLTQAGFRERYGKPLPEPLVKKAASPMMEPFCRCDDEGISLTPRGMLVSNAVICSLTELL